MNFVQKLIDDTNNGDWDFYWKYNEGSNTFSLNKPKHYLTGLNFTTTDKNKTIIFPNGSGLDTEQLSELETAVRSSLLSTMNQSIKMYLAGEVPVADTNAPDSPNTSASQVTNETSVSGTKPIEKPTNKII